MASQVLLVDDHKIMRDGIKAILRHSDDFTVMAEAETGTEAVQICKLKRPDIILMDIGLPGLNGIDHHQRRDARPQPPAAGGYSRTSCRCPAGAGPQETRQ